VKFFQQSQKNAKDINEAIKEGDKLLGQKNQQFTQLAKKHGLVGQQAVDEPKALEPEKKGKKEGVGLLV